MRTAEFCVPAAAGRYPVTEAEEGTRDWPAYQVDCPECGEPAGYRCVYTSGPDSVMSAYGRPRDYYNPSKFHLKGDMTVRPHHVRSNLAAEKAHRRAIRAYREKTPPPARDMTGVRAALAAFDLAEYEALRDWLAEHGPILWGGTRPDGSRRGESYSFG